MRYIIVLIDFSAVASGTPTVGDIPALDVSDAFSVLDTVDINTAIAGISIIQCSCQVVLARDCLS